MVDNRPTDVKSNFVGSVGARALAAGGRPMAPVFVIVESGRVPITYGLAVAQDPELAFVPPGFVLYDSFKFEFWVLVPIGS